ncbi:protein mono-ADP-ribosyltransferase PARP16-like [Bradysia coprophila]|uniref:protein mono-ADP-ribosyltransferase PARP16-like n=1 Tax=Bradysia coprophila TaxID=38358 RepID=UPI00187D870A|nr:protein mono-ADP-ribosyltransferase PARP16-like [Bradysia coprophila]
MDADDFKQLTLEILWDEKHITRFVCELRLTLFINALNVAERRPQCLMPFPSVFFDRVTKTKDIERLRHHIGLIPPLDDIKDDTEFPLLTWQLLYWIFTNPLTISALHLEEPRNVFIDRLIEETKLTDIPHYQRVIFFKINNHTNEEKFLELKERHGTFFAYHGSNFENFHSIIHRGLIGALNERSAYGFGTYLSMNYLTAFQYASQSTIWPHSRLLSTDKSVRCIGIVEVVDDASINWPGLRAVSQGSDLWSERKQCYCCVVNRDELMRLRYVLVVM